jgi:DNA-binding MurR/RpiR family transcriptional regulator
VVDLLRRSMRELTPSERRIARALLADYPVAGLVTVAELAAHASTSAATVIRLVRKLGFDGFPGFQSSLRDELSVRRTGPVERLRTSQARFQGSGVLRAMSGALAATARSVATTVPEAEFEAAVDLLADRARHVYLVGGRVSHVLAEYLESHLSRLRGGVTLLPQQAGRRAAALLDIERGDVLVAFDFRRYERDVVDAARLAEERGARLILVTDVLMSPIAARAAVVLPVEVETPSPFDSAVAGVVVVEALALASLGALGERGLSRMQTWDALAQPHLVGD